MQLKHVFLRAHQPPLKGNELIPRPFRTGFVYFVVTIPNSRPPLFDQDLLRAHLKLMNYEFNLEIHEAHEMNTSERSF